MILPLKFRDLSRPEDFFLFFPGYPYELTCNRIMDVIKAHFYRNYNEFDSCENPHFAERITMWPFRHIFQPTSEGKCSEGRGPEDAFSSLRQLNKILNIIYTISRGGFFVGSEKCSENFSKNEFFWQFLRVLVKKPKSIYINWDFLVSSFKNLKSSNLELGIVWDSLGFLGSHPKKNLSPENS